MKSKPVQAQQKGTLLAYVIRKAVLHSNSLRQLPLLWTSWTRQQFHIKSISWDRGKVEQYLTSINQLVQASLFSRVQHNFKRPKVTTLCNKFLFSYIDQRLCHFQPLREGHDAFRSYRPFPRHSEHVGDSKQCGRWAADHVWRFNARPQAAHWYQVLQRYSQTVQTWSALQGDGERRISLLLKKR